MPDQTFEIYSKRLTELIDKLSQIGLGSEEVLKVVKALNKPGGDEDIDSWFNRARDKALGIGYVLIGSFFVLFIGIMGMIASANGIPAGQIGLSAFISSVTLLACCVIAAVHYIKKATSIDRKLEQVRSAISSYRERT